MTTARTARQSFLAYLDELTVLLDRHAALARSALALEDDHENGRLGADALAEALLAHAEAFGELEADARLLPVPHGIVPFHARVGDALAASAEACVAAVADLDARRPQGAALHGFLEAALMLREAVDDTVEAGRALAAQ